MHELLLISPIAVMLALLALLVSSVCSEIIQHYLLRNISILEKPEHLLYPYYKRQIRLFVLLFPIFYLATQKAADASQLTMLWFFCGFMIFISVIDLEQQIIPDEVLFILFLASFCFTSQLPAFFLNRLLAAVAGGSLLLLLAIVTKGGIGGGDIKLLLVLGFWLGTDNLLFTALTGCLTAGIVSALLLLRKKRKPQDTIAYGPYFAFSAIIALLSK